MSYLPEGLAACHSLAGSEMIEVSDGVYAYTNPRDRKSVV